MLFRSKPAWRLCAGSIFKCVSFKVFLFSPGRSGPRVSSRPKFGHLRSVKIKQPTFLDQNNFELKRGYSFLNCAIKSHCCFRTHMRWLTLISSGCHDCCTNCSFTFRAWLQNVCNTHTSSCAKIMVHHLAKLTVSKPSELTIIQPYISSPYSLFIRYALLAVALIKGYLGILILVAKVTAPLMCAAMSRFEMLHLYPN